MSRTIRMEGVDQTTVILVEDDYIAVQVFFGDPQDEDPDHPDAVMTYNLIELHWLQQALSQASLHMADLVNTFFCMQGACECPWPHEAVPGGGGFHEAVEGS